MWTILYKSTNQAFSCDLLVGMVKHCVSSSVSSVSGLSGVSGEAYVYYQVHPHMQVWLGRSFYSGHFGSLLRW